MKNVLEKNFFERDTLTVARELLGKYLVRRIRGKDIALMITEVEAYDGFSDRASHAYKGKTERNAVMFGEAGRWYVYLVYGIYEMLNIVTGVRGYPGAVLIRGTDSVVGPGRLTKFLHVTRVHNGKRATRTNALWIEDRGIVVSEQKVNRTARIGVDYAGVWAKKKYRFLVK